MSSIHALVLAPLLAASAMPALAHHLSAEQLDAAAHAFTGVAQCDQGEQVTLTPVAGHQGLFRLQFRKASYEVAPEVTTTGAVRLEDKKAGIVWVQIPAKSMLFNAKAGHRVADGCLHAEQRSAQVAAVK